MEKVIYFGLEKDFWRHTRFKEFIESLDQMKILLKNDFSLLQESLKLPLLYYSDKYNAVIKHERELIYPDFHHHDSYGPPLQRAKVTLFGEIEKNIENLEWLIKSEAKKYQGVDNLNNKVIT